MFDGRFFGEQWEEHVGPFNLLIEIYTTYTHTHITYIHIHTWYYNILYRTLLLLLLQLLRAHLYIIIIQRGRPRCGFTGLTRLNHLARIYTRT